MTKYDVIVVGGGHAGCEAAAAAARMGVRVGLITFDATTIGAMSCNPAIGGLGKGHLVREVDALDGLIGRAADAAAIHYRMLNRSKGSAVWGPRIQADRKLFRASVQRAIASFANLAVITGEAAALLFEKDRVVGVTLADGSRVNGGAVVLCTGTFLGGVLFRGTERFVGGRFGEASASLLAKQMRDSGLVIGRLKTGTPPRLDGRTINWAALDEQPSDAEPWTMSPLTPHRINPQLRCLITRTNSRSHDIIRANLDASPLFSGDIEGVGPRYCPSIEDKVHRFGDRDGHQIFLEPEGLDTPLLYPNGISTSLPADVQLTLLRSIEGLERVEMVTPGYAVEYDHLDPRALTPGLEVRALPGLFCAGQINGTTGYEEAAAQGLIAGMHAAAACLGAEPAPLDRGNSYLAVMIDDLTLHGVSEPYRMLTARAEYRLRLRANNAATRLTSLGIAAGMVGEERCRWFEHRVRQKEQWLTALQKPAPSRELAERGLPLRRELGTKSLEEWLRYPGITLAELKHWLPPHLEDAGDIAEELTEDALYAPYVARQEGELRELRAGVSLQLGSEFLYEDVAGLSREMVERLSASRPSTLADAGRVRGITPAALAAVMVHAKRRNAA